MKLSVAFDGCRFLDLTSGQDGSAHLPVPFAPSGDSIVGIQVSSEPGQECTSRSCFEVEWGVSGIRPAIEAIRPLQSLRNAEQLVPVDVDAMQREVAIVVPVYNAPEDVERCLDSVLAHTTGPGRLIVIDDASTDAGIAPLLDHYRGIAGVEILANAENLGFTATVNRGIALAGNADVVLLNADAEVAANWLTGLRRALHSNADVATVTAVSDNAGAFSVPELEQENPFPASWNFSQAALALWQNAGLAYPQLPTGNGFCMLICREVIDRIGAFDVEAFPQGYGEENDFCQRACAAGYRHLVAGNVLVRHARSRSFGHERRAALGQAGMQVLRQRWPQYEADVGASLFSFERLVLDWRVRRIYADAVGSLPQPRVLCLGLDGEIDRLNGYHIHMIQPTDSGFALCGPNNQPLETSDAVDATTLASWLQRHAIDGVAMRTQTDSPMATLLLAEAQRLGVGVIACPDGRFPSIDQIKATFTLQRSFNGIAA